MKTYYYCKQDLQGQRTGFVGSFTINREDVTTDRFGFSRYKGHYLYENKQEAERAALS